MEATVTFTKTEFEPSMDMPPILVGKQATVNVVITHQLVEIEAE